MNRYAVIVSYYDQRPVTHIGKLLRSMRQHKAGVAYDKFIVINRAGHHAIELPDAEGAIILERENTGMNIGAWDFGWRRNPGYAGYLFLQDECLVVRDHWLVAFVNKGADHKTMVGESLNNGWDRDWNSLRATHGMTPMREHHLNGVESNRIDVYLDFMKKWHIPPGHSGRHLRSLIWYVPTPLLKKIDGFPIGHNFGECIGAEIGVSRKVIASNGRICQVAEHPFQYIRHTEWNQREVGGPFLHGQPHRSFEHAIPQAPRFIHVLKRGLRNMFRPRHD